MGRKSGRRRLNLLFYRPLRTRERLWHERGSGKGVNDLDTPGFLEKHVYLSSGRSPSWLSCDGKASSSPLPFWSWRRLGKRARISIARAAGSVPLCKVSATLPAISKAYSMPFFWTSRRFSSSSRRCCSRLVQSTLRGVLRLLLYMPDWLSARVWFSNAAFSSRLRTCAMPSMVVTRASAQLQALTSTFHSIFKGER